MEFLVLSGEAFTRDLSGSFCSVRDTLVHIIGGEWIWLAYWKTPPHSAAELTTLTTRRLVVLFNPHAFRNVAEVRLKWSEIMRRSSKVRPLLPKSGAFAALNMQ
jgi:uncharacterized damage-inducible protein DinB